MIGYGEFRPPTEQQPAPLDDLVRLAAEARAADAASGDAARQQSLTSLEVDASFGAHQLLDDACEDYRRRHHPKAGRVVANGGQVFTVSPTGRSIRVIHGGAR